VTLEFVVAFGIALLINTKFKGSGIFLFLAIIPMALPAVAVGAIWSSGFATYGWMNSLLHHLGLIEETGKIPFLAATPFQSMILIIIIDAWQVIPFMMIILLAGMQNMKEELKEAGYIFGGTRFTVLRKITIPILRPTITTAVILRIIAAIQIWLIIVMLFGFQRLPVLLEELVYFTDVATSEEFFRIGLAYSVLVAFIVSIVAVIYLKVSGAFGRDEE
jgi:multiple sugar transport system permease protein